MGRRLAVFTLLALALPATATAAPAPGLPEVVSGHRPGPDALYADAPPAPQLENVAPWTAAPILVSGATAYRKGEFLYQDYLYDDHGASGGRDLGDPATVGNFTFSPKAGGLTYPTDPVFANNAADLVELRVKPVEGATAFRITLNTLKDQARTAFTIAIGSSPAPRAWPAGAGVQSPAQLFLTVHGDRADLVDAASGAPVAPAPAVSVDLVRRQVDVRVAHAAWDPGQRSVRLAAGVGLWDVAAGHYLAPQVGGASATAPGGGLPGGAALFNVAFRPNEPKPDVRQAGAGLTIGDAAAGGIVQAAWWRERAQADALLTGDVSQFAADVDFAKLAAGADDDSAVPKTGPIDRIFASRHAFGQGVDFSRVCFALTGGGTLPRCEGTLIGQLQPYALYVPAKPQPARGWGMTLLLHSLSANYNQYLASRNQSQLGDRGAGSLVATPAGRGPDGFYTDIAEADTFEVWADVARHYTLDPDWSVVSGYSMGGFATYRLLARWPDLFARGMSTVGAPDDPATLPSLRNTPLMTWTANADELVNLPQTERTIKQLAALGLRFVSNLFAVADHLTLATNDQFAPAAAFLGEHRVDRDPPHVTYVVAPHTDSARAGAVADHAYWLSDLRVRDPKANPHGQIDVRSEGFGVGDPKPLDVAPEGGALEGGTHGPMAFLRRQLDWGPAPAAPKADRLVVKAANVASATIDPVRAHVSCAPELDVHSDGPLDLRIACPATNTGGVGACSRTVAVRLPRVRGQRVVAVRVLRGSRVVARVRGRDLRRVVLRRPTRGAFTLRLRVRTAGRGAAHTVTVTRRFGACR